MCRSWWSFESKAREIRRPSLIPSPVFFPDKVKREIKRRRETEMTCEKKILLDIRTSGVNSPSLPNQTFSNAENVAFQISNPSFSPSKKKDDLRNPFLEDLAVILSILNSRED